MSTTFPNKLCLNSFVVLVSLMETTYALSSFAFASVPRPPPDGLVIRSIPSFGSFCVILLGLRVFPQHRCLIIQLGHGTLFQSWYHLLDTRHKPSTYMGFISPLSSAIHRVKEGNSWKGVVHFSTVRCPSQIKKSLRKWYFFDNGIYMSLNIFLNFATIKLAILGVQVSSQWSSTNQKHS